MFTVLGDTHSATYSEPQDGGGLFPCNLSPCNLSPHMRTAKPLPQKIFLRADSSQVGGAFISQVGYVRGAPGSLCWA